MKQLLWCCAFLLHCTCFAQNFPTGPHQDSLKNYQQLVSGKNITEPDWKAIGKAYNSLITEKQLLDSRIAWYKNQQHWDLLAKSTLFKYQKFGIDTVGLPMILANSQLYEVFGEHQQKRKYTRQAIQIFQPIAYKYQSSREFGWFVLDTYACLLYNYGNIKDALKWEEKAWNLSEQNADIKVNFDKMKSGQKITKP